MTADAKTIEAKQTASNWANLFLRAIPECTDVEEAVMVADVALENLPKDAELSEGSHGHFIIVCSCGEIIAQCRCMDRNKERRFVQDGCEKCKQKKKEVDASFSYDIFNRKAQGILNRALEAAAKMNASARIDLAKAIKSQDKTEVLKAVVEFVRKYKVKLADLLTTTQLASLLEGAKEVAKSLPTVPMFPGAALPPASIDLKKAMALIGELRELPVGEREQKIYDMQPDHQSFIRQGIISYGQGSGEPPQAFVPQSPVNEQPERIHYPVIDEAAKSLAEKNVMSRAQFDALDSAARQKAFTVAHVESLDTLDKIRQALEDTVVDGVDLETFREKVMKEVETGTFLSDWHLETVFRTNIQTAFSDGQMTVLQHPFVRSGFPYAAYYCIRDDRVRANHKELETLGIEGTNIYRIDDPVFIMFRPPWDYCDRCSWVPMTVRQAASKGISEAQKWLDTGVEPEDRAFVQMPDFRPPVGFQRSLSGMPLSIQHSFARMPQIVIIKEYIDKPVIIEKEKIIEVLLSVQDESGEGRWITIGGQKGEDGKRHGGSPVFVVNGRITKGNPKLTGEKLGSLGSDAKDDGKEGKSSHRKEMNQEKEYQKAIWAKKVRKAGIPSKALHQLAGEMREHHNAHQQDVKSMLQTTRERAKSLGINVHHAHKAFKDGDHTEMEGFDILSRSMAKEYPHLLGDHGYDSERGYDDAADEASQKLFDYLNAGNPEAMSEADAYEQAHDYLIEHHSQKEEVEEADESAAIPFSLTPAPSEADLVAHYKAIIAGGAK